MKLRGRQLRVLDTFRSFEAPQFLPFLYPALAQPFPRNSTIKQTKCFSQFYQRCSEAAPSSVQSVSVVSSQPEALDESLLPLSCPGCGALSQTIEAEQAGHYNTSRAVVKNYLKHGVKEARDENVIFSEAIGGANSSILRQLGLDRAIHDVETPVCDRCHNLIHHQSGVPIHHPSVDALSATIAESPYKNNHVYHILDAADFPMSLIPRLQQHLHFSRMRTQNRRSKSHRYMRGGLAEMSFIITRSDLLAPKKEMVDKMMPYLTEVLREALGKTGHRVRMGTLSCVSAQRGWWTKDIKEAIYRRGGASWMVGRANVGKSSLFEVVFPRGRGGTLLDMEQLRADAGRTTTNSPLAINLDESPSGDTALSDDFESIDDYLNTKSLLPPAPKETMYPQMPVISAQAGTTASPIRLPFGNGKGELIDLPGVARRTLEDFVKPGSKHGLVMEHRVSPERISLKPQQSLLLDGLIRIVPKTPDLIFLTHSFVPLKAHRTGTHKLAEMDAGERQHPLVGTMIANPEKVSEAGGLKSAGTLALSWDVTKVYSGPITRNDAVGLKPEVLPWITYAADILIEGCGWVEIHAQVRKRKWFADDADEGKAKELDTGTPEIVEDTSSLLPGSAQETVEIGATTKEQLEGELSEPPIDVQGTVEDGNTSANAQSQDTLSNYIPNLRSGPTLTASSPRKAARFPEIEVFSPLGKFVGIRKPMNAYATGGPKPKVKTATQTRPRRSMKTAKAQRALKEK